MNLMLPSLILATKECTSCRVNHNFKLLSRPQVTRDKLRALTMNPKNLEPNGSVAAANEKLQPAFTGHVCGASPNGMAANRRDTHVPAVLQHGCQTAFLDFLDGIDNSGVLAQRL